MGKGTLQGHPGRRRARAAGRAEDRWLRSCFSVRSRMSEMGQEFGASRMRLRLWRDTCLSFYNPLSQLEGWFFFFSDECCPSLKKKNCLKVNEIGAQQTSVNKNPTPHTQGRGLHVCLGAFVCMFVLLCFILFCLSQLNKRNMCSPSGIFLYYRTTEATGEHLFNRSYFQRPVSSPQSKPALSH